MSKNYENFVIAILAAEGYYRTAKMIRAQITDGLEYLFKFSGAYVINMALACELYTKGLLIKRGILFPCNAKKGHDLFELYQLLSPDDKQVIEKSYNAEPPILEFLEQQRSIFVNHRYPYENNPARKNHPLYFKPFESLTEALSVVCVLRYDESLNREVHVNAD